MKIVKVILQIGVLFLLYEIGVFIQHTFNLLIPGSVIGLVLMFIVLATGILPVRLMENGAKFMNKHLVLFFVPATAGIMNHYELFAGKGILLVVITILSTCLVMAGSGIVSQLLAKKGAQKNA